MTDRIRLDDLTSDQYDQLCDELDQARAELQQHAEHESADAAAGSYAERAEQAEAALERVRTLRDNWAATPHWVDRVPRRAAAMLTAALEGKPEPTMAELAAAENEPAPATPATSLRWTVATQADTHTWAGDQTATSAWLADHPHHWTDSGLIIDTIDGPIPAPTGWLLARWPDGDITVMSPRAAAKRLRP